jgi:hypothetical protein
MLTRSAVASLSESGFYRFALLLSVGLTLCAYKVRCIIDTLETRQKVAGISECDMTCTNSVQQRPDSNCRR